MVYLFLLTGLLPGLLGFAQRCLGLLQRDRRVGGDLRILPGLQV
jgi:hypothetical protein